MKKLYKSQQTIGLKKKLYPKNKKNRNYNFCSKHVLFACSDDYGETWLLSPGIFGLGPNASLFRFFPSESQAWMPKIIQTKLLHTFSKNYFVHDFKNVNNLFSAMKNENHLFCE